MQKPTKSDKTAKGETNKTKTISTKPVSQSSDPTVDFIQLSSTEDQNKTNDLSVNQTSVDRQISEQPTQQAQQSPNQPNRSDEQASTNLSRPSTQLKAKSVNICPPALRERGYEINEEIGGGAFSKVYKAKYKVLFEKEIAVKVISLDKVPEFWREKCLKQELKILRKLQHPHIIKVWDIIKTRRNVFIFMDLAENNSILHYLTSLKRAIPESTARFWFVQTTGAICYMHSKGIAHRDLKLENILLDRDYNAKITDFGFSCFTYDKESRQALMSPTLCGTQAYTAPEVFTPPYEARIADIWSLGICLFEMVTFHKPFIEQPNPKKFVKILLKRDYKYPLSIENKLSDELKDLVNKMLEPDTEQRLTAHQILTHPWIVAGYSPRY